MHGVGALVIAQAAGNDSSDVYGERLSHLLERTEDANAVHALLTLGGAGSGVRTTLGDAPAEGGTLDGSEGCPELDDNPAVYDNCRLELIVDGLPSVMTSS